MARILEGRPVAAAICDALAPRISELVNRGARPTLAVVRVGEREDDLSYERALERRFAALGLGLRKIVLDEACAQEKVIEAIRQVNADKAIHGCLLFRPLPPTIDEAAVGATLDPEKDMDGITASSLFGVFANLPVGFPPCTADACMQVLAHYDCELSGARVVVLGRSLVIGRPVAMMLQAANATVTMCHTRTRDLASVCREADILVVAIGRAKTVTSDYVRPGQIVIDVGINWDDEANKLVGDVDYEAVAPVVEAITPVPGGVGSVTTAVLAAHLVEAAERSVFD